MANSNLGAPDSTIGASRAEHAPGNDAKSHYSPFTLPIKRLSTTMSQPHQGDRITVRPIRREDYRQWRPLWDGYNAFYERSGSTALPEPVTTATWERFFDPSEPVHALVAEDGELIVGLVHYLFHRSTTRLHDICYLQDLFTAAQLRGLGIGRRLIQAVYTAARSEGCSRVYWQTQATNHTARALYDKIARHYGFIVYSHELE